MSNPLIKISIGQHAVRTSYAAGEINRQQISIKLSENNTLQYFSDIFFSIKQDLILHANYLLCSQFTCNDVKLYFLQKVNKKKKKKSKKKIIIIKKYINK